MKAYFPSLSVRVLATTLSSTYSESDSFLSDLFSAVSIPLTVYPLSSDVFPDVAVTVFVTLAAVTFTLTALLFDSVRGTVGTSKLATTACVPVSTCSMVYA